MIIEGQVLKYSGEKARNINTDVIWPGSLTYHTATANEMREFVMKNYDADFSTRVKGKKILAVGENFGCGSSREQPAYALRQAGIEAIISPEFSRIFQRNALAAGLAAITSQEIYDAIEDGNSIILDLEEGIANTPKMSIKFNYTPDMAWQVQMGGLVPVLAHEIAEGYIAKIPKKK